MGLSSVTFLYLLFPCEWGQMSRASERAKRVRSSEGKLSSDYTGKGPESGNGTRTSLFCRIPKSSRLARTVVLYLSLSQEWVITSLHWKRPNNRLEWWNGAAFVPKLGGVYLMWFVLNGFLGRVTWWLSIRRRVFCFANLVYWGSRCTEVFLHLQAEVRRASVLVWASRVGLCRVGFNLSPSIWFGRDIGHTSGFCFS